MVNKKAFEMQFHWIFVLIAGALILSFFFTVAYKQKNISQERLQLTLATDIENIFTGAITSRGTAQKLPVPPQGIAFECTQGCECRFRIDKATKEFGDKPMFAPKILKDQDLTVWALELKLPYRVTNFLYLTNPNIKYYFVYGNQNLMNQLTKSIPPLIEYEKITIQEMEKIKAEEYQHTKFIMLFDQTTEPPALDDSFKKTSISGVKITPQNVQFYGQKGRQLTAGKMLSYAGLPSLYAAIFSEDETMYECGLKTAFRKLSYISKLYAERAAELELEAIAAEKTWCSYDNIIRMLNQQHEDAKILMNTLDNSLISGLNSQKENLDASNRNFIQQSCPEIF